MNYGKKGVRAKQKELNSKTTKWGRKIAFTCMKVILIGIIAMGIVGVSAGIGAFKGILASTPEIDVNDVAPVGFSTFVYDSKGNQIDKLVATNSNRVQVTMDKIPQDLADAFVAIEDQRFYDHNGIDIKGIIRAGYTFIKSGFKRAEGASTITQQLLKNTIFTDFVNEEGLMEKIQRKVQEQYLALELTKKLSKEETLLRYMNTINLGQNTLGVQAASLRYFNKDVSELTLSECAVIAAITQNPSKWNPISHPDNNASRRKKVLSDMLEQGFITQSEYDEAMADDVYARIQEVNIATANDSISSYFVDALTEALYYDLIDTGYSATQASALLYSGGLRIESTLDPDIQDIADRIFSDPEMYPENIKWYLNYELTVKTASGEYINHSKEMMKTWFVENENRNFNLIFDSVDDAYAAIEVYKAAVMADTDTEIDEKVSLTPQPQVSLTIIDQNTGYVVAMIGGRGAKEGSRTLNRASATTRQPGSTFKVVSAYAPALDSAGMTLATIFNDAPFNYNNGTPVNNWYKNPPYEGLSSIRKGIYHSMNIVTVKCLTQITPKLGFDYLENFGFTTLTEIDDCYQPMALGGISKGVTNLELCAAYATIANNGIYNKPRLYTRVLDSDGNVIIDHTVPETRKVLKETTAFLLTDAMSDTMTRGTGTTVNFGGMAIAGKTGTTSDNKDVWFAGYTPYYTAVTWAGYDNNVELNKTELNLAKKLWREVMSEIHSELENQRFPIPSGIVQAQVCSQSGKLPIAGLCDVQGTAITEYFAEGTVPTEPCDVHYAGDVCAYSNLPASVDCPFKLPGVLSLIPIEDVSLQSGSATIIQNPDGSVTPGTPETSNMCPHDAEFYTDPNYLNIIEQQRAELLERGYNFYYE